MKRLLIAILALTASCSKPQPAVENTTADIMLGDDHDPSRSELRDTVFNGNTIKFSEISEIAYDSLLKSAIKITVPLQPANTYYSIAEISYLIRLKNQKMNELISRQGVESFEQYAIKELWKQKNIVWINLTSPDYYDDPLANLIDGEFSLPGRYYEVSPRQDKILWYSEFLEKPSYPQRLEIKEVGEGPMKVLYSKEFDRVSIKNCKWLSNSELVLAADCGNQNSITLTNMKWFRVTIE